LAVASADIDFKTQQTTTLNIVDCIHLFTRPARLNEENKWECPMCKVHTCADQQMLIWSAPEVLVIHLKRFLFYAGVAEKIDVEVQFPEILDMRPFIAGPISEGKHLYRLFAVSEHVGTLEFGHYTAHAIVQDDEGNAKWYAFNDESVFEDAEGVHSQNAYVLFYQQVDSL
jgi:ubiquitin C-terminal hydrolase